MISLQKKYKFATAIAVAAALGGSATAIALSGSDPSEPTAAGIPPRTMTATEMTAPPPDPSWEPVQVERVNKRFAILRRAATSEDAVPARFAPMVRKQSGEAGTTRQVVAGSTARWLVLQKDRVCMLDSLGSLMCQTGETFEREGTLGTQECGPGVPDGKMLVFGVVPDGVEKVALRGVSGSTTAEVRENGWSAAVDRTPDEARPDTVTWDAGTGERSFEIPVSPDVNQSC